MVGGNRLDPEPAEGRVVADSEDGVRRTARPLGRDVLAARGADERSRAGEDVRQRLGIEVANGYAVSAGLRSVATGGS